MSFTRLLYLVQNGYEKGKGLEDRINRYKSISVRFARSNRFNEFSFAWEINANLVTNPSAKNE